MDLQNQLLLPRLFRRLGLEYDLHNPTATCPRRYLALGLPGPKASPKNSDGSEAIPKLLLSLHDLFLTFGLSGRIFNLS